MPGLLPTVGKIYEGEVVKAESYGAFVRIPGFQRQGLVHISQLREGRTERVDDVVVTGHKVYVKVVDVKEQGPGETPKVSLSMRYADQKTGEDLDPQNEKFERDQARGGGGRGGGGMQPRGKIELGAVVNNKCTKCGVMGHMPFECRGVVEGKSYGLIGDDEFSALTRQPATAPPPRPPPPIASYGGTGGGFGGGGAAGRGRGRALLTPAWMTKQGLSLDDATPARATSPPPPSSSRRRSRFTDAPAPAPPPPPPSSSSYDRRGDRGGLNGYGGVGSGGVDDGGGKNAALMAGRGRGRALTLPAWMTAGGGDGCGSAALEEGGLKQLGGKDASASRSPEKRTKKRMSQRSSKSSDYDSAGSDRSDSGSRGGRKKKGKKKKHHKDNEREKEKKKGKKKHKHHRDSRSRSRGRRRSRSPAPKFRSASEARRVLEAYEEKHGRK